MKRLPQAKKNQLLGVIVGTVALIFMVYFFLISPQNQKNGDLAGQIKKETTRLEQYAAAITNVQATSVALTNVTLQLNAAETDIAYGDLYQWTIDKMRTFKAGYHVDIPALSQPSSLGDCDIIANFPYKQIRFTVNGTAFFHDLGKFASDFENKFPHCRVVNLAAEPMGGGPSSGEKLTFRMDIVALVKPNN